MRLIAPCQTTTAYSTLKQQPVPVQTRHLSFPCHGICLQAKLAVRSDADELQYRVVRLSIDQHQIWLDVAISVILPIASQRVVAVLLGQCLVIRQNRDDGDKIALQRLPV